VKSNRVDESGGLSSQADESADRIASQQMAHDGLDPAHDALG
jgi:hypothetical protein